ncbi:uncharacterized protein JCM15063_003352 [Sporobolomyces koalae]|uniref:uncharacterized protein n=1 Tax=Sporobolomyces koalae TaxID=500713 RepID=UPI00317D7149
MSLARAAPPRLQRGPSFWERTKQSVGAWDSSYMVGVKVNKQTARSPGVEAFYPASLDVESIKAARILKTFVWTSPEYKIPPAALRAAAGLAILTVFRTGSLFAAVVGSGVILSRLPDGSWSSPSGLLLKKLGPGFVGGGDVYEVVLLLRDEVAVDLFSQPCISLGVDINTAPGPREDDYEEAEALSSPKVWSYVHSRALHGSAQVDGTVLIERSDENASSYGRALTAEEILNGAIRPEYWSEGLHQVILAGQDLEYDPERVPQGPSARDPSPSPSPTLEIAPSESPLPAFTPPVSPDPSIMSNLSRSSNRRLPKEDLSEEDLLAKRELEEAMRSFGIEDPTVNERSRSQDPLLVVEPLADDSFDFDTSTSTPGLTRSRSSRASSTSSGPASVHSVSNRGEEEQSSVAPDVEGAEAKPCSEEEAPSGPITRPSTPSKPPIPPRRTPRIPAPASPMIGEAIAQSHDEDGVQEGEGKFAVEQDSDADAAEARSEPSSEAQPESTAPEDHHQ